MRAKKVLLLFFFSIFLLNCCSSTCNCAGWTDDPLRGRKGWYGYEPIKEEVKVKEEMKPVIKQVERKPEKIEQKETRWPTPEELYRMKPSQINKYIKQASEEAIANPTEDNLKRWIEYMHIVEVKASEFAGAWAWVMQQNPDIYRTAALYPAIPKGNEAFWQKVWHSVKRELNEKRNDYALLFFTGIEPEFDKIMRKVLSKFKESYPGWRLEEIDIKRNLSLAKKLKITYTPQVWLLSKEKGRPFPIAAGPIALTRLEKKIYQTILVLEGKKQHKEYPYFVFKDKFPINTGMLTKTSTNTEVPR